MFAKLTGIIVALALPSLSHALVDMRNANFSHERIDLEIKTSGFDLVVNSTYNSRTLYNGFMGFGWCSEFETKLTITPENSLRITECGAGLQVEYRADSHDKDSLNKTVAAIMKEVRERNKNRDDKYFANLEEEIRRDTRLREEFARQLDLTGQVQEGTRYVASGRVNDFINLRNNVYIRSLPNGSFQHFNRKGQLIEMRDRNRNALRLNYESDRLTSVADTNGNTINFKYLPPENRYVSKVTGPRGLKATYKYEGEQLVEVNNAWGNTFKFKYDDLNNMTRIDYPDGTHVALTYNKEKDWVTSFRDRRGCVEQYAYIDGESDPKNHYKSGVVKTCGEGETREVVNRSEYEFWHRVRDDGSRYLARTRTAINDDTTITEYHPVFGLPTMVSQNNIITRYNYNSNGLMVSKVEPNRIFRYEYNNKCNKVSRVATQIQLPPPLNPDGSVRAPSEEEGSRPRTQTIVTDFAYDEDRTCNLVAARNSTGQTARLNYDSQGRISQLQDQSMKTLELKYDERFGRLSRVKRPGMGEIKFTYGDDGIAKGIESDQDAFIARQVAQMFSNLLEIIAPATTDQAI